MTWWYCDKCDAPMPNCAAQFEWLNIAALSLVICIYCRDELKDEGRENEIGQELK